jgi:hypothetical protein
MFKRNYANVMSTLAVFLLVAGGTAFAASTINSRAVKDNSLKSIDLKDGKAVATTDVIDGTLTGTDVADGSLTGTDVADASLTGDDVDETTLGQVPDSAKLAGRTAGSFLGSSVYKAESPLGPGTALGDGTFIIDEACDPGDVLLSGGPANVNPTSTMVESFSTPGTTDAWRARINKNANADNFSVVVLCVDQ